MNIEYKLVDLLDSICKVYRITCKDVLQTKIAGRKPFDKNKLAIRDKIVLVKGIFIYWAKLKYGIDNDKLTSFLGLKGTTAIYLHYDFGREYANNLKLEYKWK